MSDANLGPDGQPTIGNLVKEATASASTLVRAEIALAKSELVTEAKKAGAGSGLLAVAGVMLLYTSIFFFIFVGVLLDIWLPAWAAWGIVFLFLLIVTIVMTLVGVMLLKKLRAPEKTIESVKELATVMPGQHDTPAGGYAHPQIPPARGKQ
ncbi:MAG: phage holin family protein [Gordonia sp. (in: high G+C Gram-positive bacteria)]